MTYYTKAEKDAYSAGEKERSGVVETLMQRIEELVKQVGEQCERANLWDERYTALSDAFKTERKLVDSVQNKMKTEHDSERNRWQAVVDDLNIKLANLEWLQTSTAQINLSLIEERDELAMQKGKMLASNFKPYTKGYDTAKAKADERIMDLMTANNDYKERLQASENERRRIERILAAFDPATLHGASDGERKIVDPTRKPHGALIDKVGTWGAGITRPDLVHDEVEMTKSPGLFVQQFGRAYRPFNGDKNSPTFKAGYDQAIQDSKAERQQHYYDGRIDGYVAGFKDGVNNT